MGREGERKWKRAEKWGTEEERRGGTRSERRSRRCNVRGKSRRRGERRGKKGDVRDENKGCRRRRRRRGKSKKKEKKEKFVLQKKKPGHLVRWNYISDAHTALMLLSRQHTARGEMVYLHVRVRMCVRSLRALKASFRPWKFFTPYPKPLIRIERLLALEKNQKKNSSSGQAPRGTVERRELPAPRKTPVQAAQRDIKRTGGG